MESSSTYLILVELCCFPVQCLEERWHNTDVSCFVLQFCFRTLAVILVSDFCVYVKLLFELPDNKWIV